MLVLTDSGPLFLEQRQVTALRSHLLPEVSDEDLFRYHNNKVPFSRFDHWQEVARLQYNVIANALKGDQRERLTREFGISAYVRLEGDAAAQEVLQVLHAYGLLSGYAQVVPVPRNLVEREMNNAQARDPWAYLYGDSARLLFNSQPVGSVERLLRRRWDSYSCFNCEDVVRVAGRIDSFTVSLSHAHIECDQGVRVHLVPSAI